MFFSSCVKVEIYIFRGRSNKKVYHKANTNLRDIYDICASISMYILVYIEQNVLFWPRSDPKSPCPSRSSIGRRWMVGAV